MTESSPVVGRIDLGAEQQRILQELEQAEQELEQAGRRVWALRGQLDLIARLNQQAQQSAPAAPAGPPDPPPAA